MAKDKKISRTFSHRFRSVDPLLGITIRKLTEASLNTYIKFLQIISQCDYFFRDGRKISSEDSVALLSGEFKKRKIPLEKHNETCSMLNEFYNLLVAADVKKSRGVLGLLIDKTSKAGKCEGKTGRLPTWKKFKNIGDPRWEEKKLQYDESKKDDQILVLGNKIKDLGVFPFFEPAFGQGKKGKMCGVGPFDRLAWHKAMSIMTGWIESDKKQKIEYAALSEKIANLKSQFIGDQLGRFVEFENKTREKQKTFRITGRYIKSWMKIYDKWLKCNTDDESIKVLKKHKADDNVLYLWLMQNKDLWLLLSKYVQLEGCIYKLGKMNNYAYFPTLDKNTTLDFMFNKEDLNFILKKEGTEAEISLDLIGGPTLFTLVNSKQQRCLKYNGDTHCLSWEDRQGRKAQGKLTAIGVKIEGEKTYANLVVDRTPEFYSLAYNNVADREKSAWHFQSALFNSKHSQDVRVGCRALAVDLGWNPLVGCSVFELASETKNLFFKVGKNYAVHLKSFMWGKPSKGNKLYGFLGFLNKLKREISSYKSFNIIEKFNDDIKTARKKFYKIKYMRGLNNNPNNYVWIDCVKAYIDLIKSWNKLNINHVANVKSVSSDDMKPAPDYAGNLWKYYRDMKDDTCKKIASFIVHTAADNSCDYILHEDLFFVKQSSYNTNYKNNRIAKWAVQGILNEIKKQAEVYGIVVVDIDPRYSSHIDIKTGEFGRRYGNLLYPVIGANPINCQLSATWVLQNRFWTQNSELVELKCKVIDESTMLYVEKEEGSARIKGAIKALTGKSKCAIIKKMDEYKLVGLTDAEYNKMKKQSGADVVMYRSGGVWRTKDKHWDRINKYTPVARV